mmetsp:Transcript_1021/g.1092  ORF Transcript_1021/g.1092 Transcript_1021/m.1092 type:complete len:234 (+) Transcript_1021:282-983(+)
MATQMQEQENPNEVFEDLKEYLSQVRNTVLEWKEKEEKETENARTQFLGQSEKAAEKISELKKEEKEFKSVEKINQLRLEKEQREIDVLTEKLKSVEIEEQKVEPLVQNASKRKDDMIKSIEEQNQEIKALKKKQEYEMQQLTRGMKLYKMLGLSFEKVSEDWLKLSFTHIDPNDHSREFYFVVFLDRNDVYHIQEVNPVIGNVQPLINELNETNNFSLFVRRMRKRFKELVA